MTGVFPPEIWIQISQSLQGDDFRCLLMASPKLLKLLSLARDLIYIKQIPIQDKDEKENRNVDHASPYPFDLFFNFEVSRPLVTTQPFVASSGGYDFFKYDRSCTTFNGFVFVSSLSPSEPFSDCRFIDISGISCPRCGEDCDHMENKNASDLRILNYSHSIVTFMYRGERNEVLVAMRPQQHDPGGWDIIWTQFYKFGSYNKHIVRNNSKWLVHIYADESHSHHQSFNLEPEKLCYESRRAVDVRNLGYDSCCEVRGDLLYFIKRKIEPVPGSNRFLVSYCGAIFQNDEALAAPYHDISIPEAYVSAGRVQTAQMSFQAGRLIDMIGVWIDCRDKKDNNMQWSCFVQKLDRSGTADGPAHLLYVGPTCCKMCTEHCHSSVRATIARGYYQNPQVMKSRFRKYPPSSIENRTYI